MNEFKPKKFAGPKLHREPVEPSVTPLPDTLEARLAAGVPGISQRDISDRIYELEHSHSPKYSESYKNQIISYLKKKAGWWHQY